MREISRIQLRWGWGLGAPIRRFSNCEDSIFAMFDHHQTVQALRRAAAG